MSHRLADEVRLTTAPTGGDRSLPTLCRPSTRQRGRQHCSESGRSPPGGFGAPEPQESGAGQRSFVGAGNRPTANAVPAELAAEKQSFDGRLHELQRPHLQVRGARASELDGRTLRRHLITGDGSGAAIAGHMGKPAVLKSLGKAVTRYHAREDFMEIDTIVPSLHLISRLLMELGPLGSRGLRPVCAGVLSGRAQAAAVPTRPGSKVPGPPRPAGSRGSHHPGTGRCEC